MQELNFNVGIVKKGTKSQSEATSTIRLLSTIGNFQLNNKAMAELGIAIGDNVLFFDMFNSELESQESRYFICNGEGLTGAAKVGTNRMVSNSSVYHSMLLADPTVKSASKLDLRKADKLNTTEKSEIAAHTITCDLVPYQDGAEVEVEGKQVKVFQFTNFVEVATTGGVEDTEIDDVEE